MMDDIEIADWQWLGNNWQKVSQDAKDLIKGMMNPDTQARFTITKCLAHPWIKGTTAGVDLRGVAEEIKEFQARKRLKGAILGLMATNKLKNLVGGIKQNKS